MEDNKYYISSLNADDFSSKAGSMWDDIQEFIEKNKSMLFPIAAVVVIWMILRK